MARDVVAEATTYKSSRILTAELTFARILIVVDNVGGGQFLALAEVFELAVPVELPDDV